MHLAVSITIDGADSPYGAALTADSTARALLAVHLRPGAIERYETGSLHLDARLGLSALAGSRKGMRGISLWSPKRPIFIASR